MIAKEPDDTNKIGLMAQKKSDGDLAKAKAKLRDKTALKGRSKTGLPTAEGYDIFDDAPL